MNIASMLREEGREEEKVEIALRMLKEGTDPVFVSKVTKISLQKIKKLMLSTEMLNY